MSFTRQMRRNFERNNRTQFIAAAGQKYIAEQLRPRPRFIPRFVWTLLLRAVFKV